MTLSSLRRTAVSSSTVQTNSPAESLLLLSPALSSSAYVSKHLPHWRWKRTHEPWLFLRGNHQTIIPVDWRRRDHLVVVSRSDPFRIVEHHFEVGCQGLLSKEADENSKDLFFCVLWPRVRVCRRPGVESPGKGCPHIGQWLRYGLPLNSSAGHARVVKSAG
jgi:hypothetical protein